MAYSYTQIALYLSRCISPVHVGIGIVTSMAGKRRTCGLRCYLGVRSSRR